jgi:diguanylate cyclase
MRWQRLAWISHETGMRYKQNREQTAELLRMVLPLMARHSAGFNPTTFTVWYEYVAGINPRLSAAVDTRLSERSTLSDDDMVALYDRHIAERDIESSQIMRTQIERLVGEVDSAAFEAGKEVRQFGDELTHYGKKLQLGIGQDQLDEVVASLAQGTSRVRTMTDSLSEHLKKSSQEVERLRAELEVAQGLAWRDPLTGLLNRRGLDQRLARDWSARPGGCGALVIDIDRFKAINDAHGHLLGDKVIIAVARALAGCVGERGPIARIGGEEFAALLLQTPGERAAAAVAEQVRATVERGRIRRADADQGIGGVTISIGVAMSIPGERFEALLERADRALYQSKSAGRNRVTVADSISSAAV